MNIFVCVKQVPDTETKIKPNADQSGIDPTGIKWILSSFDEYAVEEALRVREKNPGSTVTVISAGPLRAAEGIRTALAMGADNGVRIDLPENADNAMTAKAVASVLQKESKVDLVLTGKEAIDDGGAQVAQRIAEHLSLPHVSVVSGIEYLAGSLKCKREIEGGALEMIETPLPAVVTAQKGLNEPRYATLPNIMKAKKKEIKTITMSELGVTESDRMIRYKNFQLPAPKPAGKKIQGDPAAQAKELVRLLHEEAKVV